MDTVRTVQQATDVNLVNAIRDVYVKDKASEIDLFVTLMTVILNSH